jgi:transcriptional regulator with XRE-family HTH domain
MMKDMIGERIREARNAREWSLTDVAAKAHISVATLSRIERDKQTLDLGLFLTLMRILELDPAEILTEDDREAVEGKGIDPLVARITSLAASERARLWRALSARNAAPVVADRRHATRNVALQVEELLAQVEYLHNEVAAVQKRLKRK